MNQSLQTNTVMSNLWAPSCQQIPSQFIVSGASLRSNWWHHPSSIDSCVLSSKSRFCVSSWRYSNQDPVNNWFAFLMAFPLEVIFTPRKSSLFHWSQCCSEGLSKPHSHSIYFFIPSINSQGPLITRVFVWLKNLKWQYLLFIQYVPFTNVESVPVEVEMYLILSIFTGCWFCS